jgi:hypothetical protein
MFKTILVTVGVLAAAPLLAGESPALKGNKVTTSIGRVPCPETGTRIRPSRDGVCVATGSYVKSYSREEIERTGETNVSEALRKLDPSFR